MWLQKLSFLLFVLSPALFYGQQNMTMLSSMDFPEGVNDIWGYDGPDGSEYALLGLHDGVAIISLTDPTHPELIHKVEGPNSNWRDIKVYADFAYITTEAGGGGLMVIDLRNLPESVSNTVWKPEIPQWGTLGSCHNLFIDEYGYAYLAGCSVSTAGFIIVDVFSEPGSPKYVGLGPFAYNHDVFVRDNIAYSSEMSKGLLSIYDVSDKQNIKQLGSSSTPYNFTHHAWISDDGQYAFVADEVDNAPVSAYDISDFNDIRKIDEFRTENATANGDLPHNVHVHNDWLVISYYREGCVIVDISRPSNMVQVAQYDTYDGFGIGTFSGVWGVYPYLPSGVILVSDWKESDDGVLYILECDYKKAAYLEGSITDSITGLPVNNAQVTLIIDSEKQVIDRTNASGSYGTGYDKAGNYTVEISRTGYESATASVELINDQVFNLDIELVRLPKSNVTGTVFENDSERPIENATILIKNNSDNFIVQTDKDGNFSVDLFKGIYEIQVGKWGYNFVHSKFLNANNNVSGLKYKGKKGYYDDFNAIDYHWKTADDNPFSISWVRDKLSENYTGQPSSSPQGGDAYFLGNKNNKSQDFLYSGTASLTSPQMDLSNYNVPLLSFDYWYLSRSFAEGSYPLMIEVSNGDSTTIIDEFITSHNWRKKEYYIADYISLSENMTVTFTTTLPEDGSAYSFAALDYFSMIDNDPISSVTYHALSIDATVSPNPSSDYFTFSTSEVLDPNNELIITNLQGQVVRKEEATESLRFGQDLEKGIYFISLYNSGRLYFVDKVIKL